jgi:hypothetical protein
MLFILLYLGATQAVLQFIRTKLSIFLYPNILAECVLAGSISIVFTTFDSVVATVWPVGVYTIFLNECVILYVWSGSKFGATLGTFAKARPAKTAAERRAKMVLKSMMSGGGRCLGWTGYLIGGLIC